MKRLKKIIIKNRKLRFLRNCLRYAILKAIASEDFRLDKLKDLYFKEANNSMAHYIYNQKKDLNQFKEYSILMCKDCGLVEEDMVFVPAIQPCYEGWYCINCYNERAKDYAKYYILSDSERDFNYRFIIKDDQTFIKALESIGWIKEGDVFPVKPPRAEFKVNNYISLQFRNDITILFVNNEQFNQCVSLFIFINKNDIRQRYIESIDEAAEAFEAYEAAEAFWGHCSNLQAWYENNYDTRLLHSNLSFPLLKKLTEAGDTVANKVFKEEIAKRYRTGYPTVKEYLRKEGYLNYLTKEELSSIEELS